MYDEVFKLITLKRAGINVQVPEHLQQEFDERWAECETNRVKTAKLNKLMSDPLSVETYNIATLQRAPAEYVLFEDYKLVVEHLQEKLSRAQSEASAGRHDSSTSWRD
jgi:hypothetical protein